MFFFLNIIRDYSLQPTKTITTRTNGPGPILEELGSSLQPKNHNNNKLWTDVYSPKTSDFIKSDVKNRVKVWLENHKQLYFFNIELSNYKNTIYRHGIIMNISSTRELILLCKKFPSLLSNENLKKNFTNKSFQLDWGILHYDDKKKIINKCISFSIYRTNKILDDDEYTLIINYINKLYQRVSLLDNITLTYGMILYGISGIGKSKFIELLAEELQFTTIEIDETNLTKKGIDELRDISNTINVGILGEIGSNKPKLILIDPLSPKIYDKAAIQGILKFSNPLKGNRNATYVDREKLLANLIPPIICICNNIEFSSKKIIDLKKNFECIEVKPPSSDVIYDLITSITIDHNMKITKKAKYYIIEKCSGDIRQLVGFLYSLYIQQKINNVPLLITSGVCDDSLFYKDKYLATTHIDASNILLRNPSLNMSHLLDLYEVDNNYITNSVFENYINCIDQTLNDDCDQIHLAKKIIDDLSIGDVVYTDYHIKQYWDTSLTHSYYNILSPYHHLNSSGCITPKNIVNKPYRSLRSFSLNYPLFNTQNDIPKQALLHLSKDLTYIYTLRQIILHKLLLTSQSKSQKLESIKSEYKLTNADILSLFKLHTFPNARSNASDPASLGSLTQLQLKELLKNDTSN